MNTEQRVESFIMQNFYVQPGSVGSETSLVDSGVVDSTGMLELIAFLESEYDIALEENEVTPENLGTIARIAAFVERKTAAERKPGPGLLSRLAAG